MYIFYKKLQRLKGKLREWNKLCFKNIFAEERLEAELEMLSEKVISDGMTIVEYEKEKSLMTEYNEILAREECYWKSKSREMWLGEGDQNTKFFHNTTKMKRGWNQITQTVDYVGNILTANEDIQRDGMAFFKNLLGHCGEVEPLRCGLLNDIPRIVNYRDNAFLMGPTTMEEAKEATFAMHQEKGPNRFPALVFQKCWDFMGGDIWGVVEESRKKTKILNDLNNTNIVLIQKKNDAESFLDYHPISLCNTIYKIISKVMANRLKRNTQSRIARTKWICIKREYN